MADFIYNRALKQLLSGEINLTSDTLKIALMGTGYTPNADHDFLDNGANDASDPSFNEISGTGYSQKTVASKTFTESDANDRGEFDAADVVWTGLDAGTAKGALLFKDTGDPTTSILIGWIDSGGFPKPTNGGDFTIQWAATGLMHALSGTP